MMEGRLHRRNHSKSATELILYQGSCSLFSTSAILWLLSMSSFVEIPLFNSSEFADQEFAAHDSPAFPTFSPHAVFPLPVPAFMVRNSSFWTLHGSRSSNLYYRSSKREDPGTLSHLCCDIGMRENKKLVLFGIYVVAKMITVLHVYQRPPSTSSVCLLLGGLNWISWGLPRFSRSKAWLPRQAEL